MCRVDEDFKRKLQSSYADGAGMMENIAQADSSLGKDGRRFARRIGELAIHMHIQNEWERHSEQLSGPYGLTQDAARHGNPAEDLENYVLWSSNLESGCWLPTMVHLGSILLSWQSKLFRV